MPKTRRMSIVALAVVPLMVVGAGVAWAAATDNMFPTLTTGMLPCEERGEEGADANGTPCQTDNADVSYYMDSSGEYELESEDRSVVTNTLADQYSPTDLAIHYDSSPVFSGDAETDIIYQEGSTGMPDSIDGVAWCQGVGPDLYDCDQQYVRIRGNGEYFPGLVCHETGHAVGLLHGNQAYPALSTTDSRLGCMQTGALDYNASLGANNIENINDTY